MREMRRKDREIPGHAAKALLEAGEFGILSTAGPDGQPYGLPLSYAFKDNCLYFHCAVDGHKIENMDDNPKVSFCVVGKTRLLPDKFATEYESAVAFGVVSEVRGEERRNALVWLLEKYSPDYIEEGKVYIEQKDKVTKVMKITIDRLSGKARR